MCSVFVFTFTVYGCCCSFVFIWFLSFYKFFKTTVQCISTIPLLLSDPFLFFTSVPLKNKTKMKLPSTVLSTAHIVLDMWCSLKHHQPTGIFIHKENSLCQKVSIPNSSLDCGGTSCLLLPSMLGFCLTWHASCRSCMYCHNYWAVIYVPLACGIWKRLFPFGHLLPWVLTTSSSFTLISEPWEDGVKVGVLFKAEHSVASSSLHFDQFQSHWGFYSSLVQRIRRLL